MHVQVEDDSRWKSGEVEGKIGGQRLQVKIKD